MAGKSGAFKRIIKKPFVWGAVAATIFSAAYFGPQYAAVRKVASPKVIEKAFKEYGAPPHEFTRATGFYDSAVKKGATYNDVLTLETSRLLILEYEKNPKKDIGYGIVKIIERAKQNIKGFEKAQPKRGK